LMFLDHTQRRTTVGRTPLDEWSARRIDLYLTTHKNSQQTNIHAPGGIRTHDLNRRAAADPRLRPRGHWDRHLEDINKLKRYISFYTHPETQQGKKTYFFRNVQEDYEVHTAPCSTTTAELSPVVKRTWLKAKNKRSHSYTSLLRLHGFYRCNFTFAHA